MFTVLTCWFMLTTVTSEWRGGSEMTLSTYWIPSYACVLLTSALISSLDQCRKLCYVLGFSLIPILLATLAFQREVEGRDVAGSGTLGNPNDLAFSLLLLIPFAVLVIRSESALNWKALVSAAAVAWALVKILRTGSRSAMLCMVVCSLTLLLAGTFKTKVRIVVAAALVAAIAAAFVPANILLRYGTVFSGTSYEAEMTPDELSAVESSRARKMLFEESVRLTLEHPVFGVGPGIFSAALAGEQQARGGAADLARGAQQLYPDRQRGGDPGVSAVRGGGAVLPEANPLHLSPLAPGSGPRADLPDGGEPADGAGDFCSVRLLRHVLVFFSFRDSRRAGAGV
jgi:hypothetical protein